MEETNFTVVILHKDHDRRSESLTYLLRSLANIEGNFDVVIIGDVPNARYTNLTIIESQAEKPFDAIATAVKQNPDAFNQDLIIMSDDMIIANPCPTSVLIIPKRNAHNEERSCASHCPFFADKRIFAEADRMPDISEMKEWPLERQINKFLSIEDEFCFPVHYLVAPLLGSFVSKDPQADTVIKLFKERYFIHIRDLSFKALRPMLIKVFPNPSKYEGIADEQPAPATPAKKQKGDAADDGKKSEEGSVENDAPAPDATGTDEKKDEQPAAASPNAEEQPAAPEK